MKTTPILPVIALAFAIFVNGYIYGTRKARRPKPEAKPIATNIVDSLGSK